MIHFLYSTTASTNTDYLLGHWKGQAPNYEVSLSIESNNQCLLTVSKIREDKNHYFSGKCAINRQKAPTALSINNLPAHDFSLHTIITRIDNERLLMAPPATLKRARPITFSNAFILEKQ